MNGTLVLIPIALGLGLFGLAAFFWSVMDGQFDDPDGAALRILGDNDKPIECAEDVQPESSVRPRR